MHDLVGPEAIDRMALQDLIARYAHAVDERDVARVAGCFAPDGRLSANGGTSTAHGREAIESYFADAFTRASLGPGTRSSHLLTNTVVHLDGDRAEIVTLGLAVLARPDGATVTLRGLRYADRCQRSGDEWLISDRQHEALWQCEAPGGVL
jgi:uncharacterized protein (TIGR02246 family)